MYSVSLNQQEEQNKLGARHLIYFVAFLYTLHLTPAVYVTSNFISQYVSESRVGFVYSAASFLTILMFVFIRPILVRFGNFKTFLTTLFVGLSALGLLIIPGMHPMFYVGVLVVNLITHATTYLHLDIFISSYSDFKDTGVVRSSFLMAQNIAFVGGPLLAGAMLKDHEFWKIFLFGIIMLIPTIIIAIKYLRKFTDPVYKKTEWLKTTIKTYRNKDIYNAVRINLLLRVFYSWMIIYAPIFLTLHIGFTLGETASIIGIALIAFLIFTNPLGYISDKVLGEKEILIAGFTIMAIATSVMSFVDIKDFWLWAAILFMTRVGASMVELMGESYFFKKIDNSEINMVSMFRMLRPMTNLIFPALASGLLLIIDIKYLFLILGIIMLYGIKYSLAIKDTR
jgi:MFS family permease